VLGGGQAQLARALLRLDDGLHHDVAVEPSILQILLRLDGRRPLGAVLAETATAAPPEIDRESWMEGALPGIARLVELGFLVPTGEALG
jgi:hypothetical protein